MTNAISKQERAGTMFGVEGRYFGVVAADNGRILNQQFKATRSYQEKGHSYRITVEVRFDDECKNGHETFAITADIREDGREFMGGCCHDEIAKRFPELAPLIKWHLVSTDGPMYYLANTLYHAGDRDYNGLRAGESKQIRNGRTGELCWTLEARNAPGVKISSTPTGDIYRERATVPLFILDRDARGEKPTSVPMLEWVPLLTRGEGKKRELDHARNTAVWPEATDAELCADDLADKLQARLPGLLIAFKTDMLAAGFVWPAVSA